VIQLALVLKFVGNIEQCFNKLPGDTHFFLCSLANGTSITNSKRVTEACLNR